MGGLNRSLESCRIKQSVNVLTMFLTKYRENKETESESNLIQNNLLFVFLNLSLKNQT